LVVSFGTDTSARYRFTPACTIARRMVAYPFAVGLPAAWLSTGPSTLMTASTPRNAATIAASSVMSPLTIVTRLSSVRDAGSFCGLRAYTTTVLPCARVSVQW